MKRERNRLGIVDICGRGTEIIFESNWNSLVKKGEYMKITIEDKELIVHKDHLYSVLFMIGDEKDQDRAIGKFFKQTPVRTEYHTIQVETTRDLKKGEPIVIPLAFSVNLETGGVTISKGVSKGRG